MTPLPTSENKGFFDLSRRIKLRITGSDAARFLNGQMSNDLRKATETFAIQASVLNAKGKMQASIFVSIDGDSFLVDADPEVRDELPLRLERYIIADDVQVHDVTEDYAIFHILEDPLDNSVDAVRRIKAERFGRPGWDIWVAPSDARNTRETLATKFAYCDEKCAEVFRIEQGIPRWGHELTDEIIPTEANLEATSIDYSKGCYIGQEVISRIKMSGQTNKRLCGLISVERKSLQMGMRLLSQDAERKDAGWITSTTHSVRLEKEIALGYVKRGFSAVGSHLNACLPDSSADDVVPVEVVTIPFVKG